MKSLLREPLFQFLALGGALFLIFGLFQVPEPKPPLPKIEITPGRINMIFKDLEVHAKRSPTTQELENQINLFLREEVLFREAKRRGLDLEDAVIRARLATRMDALNAELATPPTPTDADLEEIYKSRSEVFKRNGELPPLAEIRGRVEVEWMKIRQNQAKDEAFAKLREQYVIEIARPSPATQPATTQP